MLLLVPADPLRPAKPDDHFAPEATAAAALGFAVSVVDIDALGAGDVDAAVRRVAGTGEAVYRGWMLLPAVYEAFAGALDARGVTLRTTPSAYAAGHLLPLWYSTFADVTPRSVALPGSGSDGLEEALATLGAGSAVIKDHVKSMKHHWADAMFIADVTDLPAARRVVARFLELRGADIVGGVVVRAHENLTGVEARTWWIGGSCRLVTAHPDAPEAAPGAVPVELCAAAVARLGSPFVAVDLAQRADGPWRVVEVGDGQVSDRPATTDPSAFIRAIAG